MRTKKSRYSRLTPAIALFLYVALLPTASSAEQESLPVSQYDHIIVSVAQEHRVPASLVHSIIKAESGYDPWAISPKGAMGLMQLMPETAIQYKVQNVFDPKQNIEGGVKYLVDLIKLYDGDTKHVLAAYNAGQEAIKKYGGVPPYPETKNYIKKVMTAYPESRIYTRTKIYSFYDENGRYVLTNNKALWERYKKKSNEISDSVKYIP
jgi:soluble lytic murein transglycosylase-like protein